MEEASTLNLDKKLNEHFAGRVVRKDLSKLIKEGANVPIYVLEYLLGMYAATDDEASILEGVERVKKILAENFVRPDEAEKIKSRIRELGQYSIIDKVTVALNPKIDTYEAEFSNLGLKGVPVSSNYVKEFDKLLVGGIWCMVKIDYFFDEEVRNTNPFSVSNLKPIQMPNMDINEVFEGRKQFTKEEWIDVLIRSTGMEPTQLEERVKWHLLLRLVPLVENNYNILVDKGIHVKATGFGRVELNVENALKSIYEANPNALMFGTDLPSTRAKRPFDYADIEIIQHLFDEQAADKILYTNALNWYFK